MLKHSWTRRYCKSWHVMARLWYRRVSWHEGGKVVSCLPSAPQPVTQANLKLFNWQKSNYVAASCCVHIHSFPSCKKSKIGHCDAVVIDCAKSLQLRKVAKSLESIFFQKRQFSEKLSQDSFAAMASPPHSRRLQYCELLTLCDCFYFRWKLKLLWLSLCVCLQISKLLLQTAVQGRMAQHSSCVGLDPGMSANVCRKNVKCRSLMVTICTVT